jgi:thiamine-monophosphate kinase
VTGKDPIGEFDLIARVVKLVEGSRRGDSGGGGSAEILVASGDDAAVTAPRGVTATSVDALVEGIHFRRETASLQSIGWKAVAAALSDLAAMGATPGEGYVQLGVPADLDEDGSVELATGIAAAAAAHDLAVIGGDVTRAPVLVLAMTVVGHAGSADELVVRSGATPGDVVVITGALGGAAAGLLLLERPELSAALDGDLAESLRRRQLEPVPRLAAGLALAAGGASAMIDVSDGLGGDAGHLATSSGVRIVIDSESVPAQPGVHQVAEVAGVDPRDLVTASGEDYELLATLPAPRVADARASVEATGTRLTAIGEVEEGTGAFVRQPDGSEREASGFDQLRR